jgi:rare lipoprotein A
MQLIRLSVLFVVSATLWSCTPHHYPTLRAPAPQPPVASIPSPPSAPRTPPPHVSPGTYSEEGIASWYGVPYHGRRAANGEIYDMYKLTAAHRTLPFESIVRVTNLKNGRTAEVRITDRGPFVENRVIDLSLAAARALDIVSAGTARVRLDLLAGTNPREGSFAVQVAAFQSKDNADRMRARLEQRYLPVSIQTFDSPVGMFYRVRVGSEPSQDAAKRLATRLASEENVTPFVVRLDP